MNAPIVICDHGLVDASLVPALCLGKPGYCPGGIYETLVWEPGQAHDWEKHLERLADGCKHLGIKSSLYTNVFTQRLVGLLAAENGLLNVRCRLRLMVYLLPQTLTDTKQTNFRCIAALWPAPAVEPTGSGFKCAISPTLRDAGNVSYNYKLLGQAQADIDLAGAVSVGFEDTLFFNCSEELCEASYSNVWLVKDGELFTPPIEAPCLPGIVRGKIIEAAKNLEIPVSDNNAITRDFIIGASEIFLTSSVRGIQHVTAVEGLVTLASQSESAILSVLREQVKI